MKALLEKPDFTNTENITGEPDLREKPQMEALLEKPDFTNTESITGEPALCEKPDFANTELDRLKVNKRFKSSSMPIAVLPVESSPRLGRVLKTQRLY